MKVTVATAMLAAVAAVVHAAYAGAHVHHGVHRQLQQHGVADIVVVMHESPSESMVSSHEQSFATRGAKIQHVVDQLEAAAVASQRSVSQLLRRESSGQYQSEYLSWSTNSRYIKGASMALIEELATVAAVKEIRLEEVFYQDTSEDKEEVSSSAMLTDGSAVEWGVGHIRADQLWQKNVTGEGIVVGSIDSGARATHVLLRDSFRGEYGWYAPFNKTSKPYDVVGHGTHTIGTMVGGGGIGVAPGAKWMACMACPFACPETGLIQCGEWMTCPTDSLGNNKDCSKAPHVINFSLQIKKSEIYVPVVNAWREAGIIPVFAQGNSGPNCGILASPGDFANGIGVGNIAPNGTLSRTSSRGPSISGIVKPDLVAPGVEVISAIHRNDTGLVVKSGTSMAAPHVAGSIALLLSAQPTLTYDQVYAILTSTTDQQSVDLNATNCDNTTTFQWPNSNYGWGLVDVYSAALSVLPTH